MVALLPLPVMPSRVWKRSPRSSPSASAAMAAGWSPEGSKSDTMRNGLDAMPSTDARWSNDARTEDKFGNRHLRHGCQPNEGV